MANVVVAALYAVQSRQYSTEACSQRTLASAVPSARHFLPPKRLLAIAPPFLPKPLALRGSLFFFLP